MCDCQSNKGSQQSALQAKVLRVLSSISDS